MAGSPNHSNMDVDKLTNQIFSILENKFLFGYHHEVKQPYSVMPQVAAGKVRILSIDAGGSTDGILSAKALVHLEAILRRKSGDPNARIADYFDVVAGSDTGGVLGSLLFTRGKDGSPLLTSEESFRFMVENLRKSPQGGAYRRFFRSTKSDKAVFRKVFGDMSLKDTVKAVLIPCYDMTTGAPFLFSRADAFEMDGCNFSMAAVCRATVAGQPVEVKSTDGRTKMAALGGGVGMSNPTAAAITHVLNNKQEFPMCKGVEDLLVVSLGNGECSSEHISSSPSPMAAYVKIAGDGAADMVDQAVSMAFSRSNSTSCSNYIRIQGNGTAFNTEKKKKNRRSMELMADQILGRRNVESVLFKGKRSVEHTNLERMEMFAGELIKEQERRKNSSLPTVILKQSSSSPRTSSATTLSTLSSYN
ncbi:patatin-like protein 3 [Dorcoceras hygrometricum]|uniref:Patatin-like protein 3 n=1 Tax=Dorcoceras hygrometricum TaxID=472368 RepID=A0A2Z7D3J4_9LAMI|nr:patatin-like protein 3 [Dorcoceras hygrometricum]